MDPKPTPTHRRVTPDRRANARGGRRTTDSQESRERRAKQIAEYLSRQQPMADDHGPAGGGLFP